MSLYELKKAKKQDTVPANTYKHDVNMECNHGRGNVVIIVNPALNTPSVFSVFFVKKEKSVLRR